MSNNLEPNSNVSKLPCVGPAITRELMETHMFTVCDLWEYRDPELLLEYDGLGPDRVETIWSAVQEVMEKYE